MGDPSERPIQIGDIHLDLHVSVAEPVDIDPAQVVLDFLDTVDPDELKREALSGADLSSGVIVGALGVLRRWAVERARS